MNNKIKTMIFLGIVALIAIIAGFYVQQQAAAPQSEEVQSPALNISKQRAQQNKTPVVNNKTKK
ncbi:MAG: hypothetical protein HY918_01745 [Candidatus Doudnabacteria bacterium]|nr:hypothetical protein [Candidatus Doudnabacteria bacterium]